MKYALAVFSLIMLFHVTSFADSGGEEPKLPEREIDYETGVWFGLYTKYMISNRLFYYGEYHLRRAEWMQDMSKLYLRFGLAYLVNNNLEITAGAVTPFTWYQISSPELEDRVVGEFRFWQQFLFVQEIWHSKIYHQFRFEERWRRDHFKGDPYLFSMRYRYKFNIYTPLNRDHMQKNTVFMANNAEVFIQSGRHIQFNNLEEIRLFNGIGYLLDNNWQFQIGFSWHYAQKSAGYNFRRQDIIRVSVYHNMDLRRR